MRTRAEDTVRGDDTRSRSDIGRRVCPVVENRPLGTYRLIEVEDGDGPQPVAGQFYMVATARGWGEVGRPYLPRAMSALRVDEGVLGFLLEGIGPGTRRLAEARGGEHMHITGPLGRGFTRPEDLVGVPARPILVSGGIGVPPIAALERELIAGGGDPRVLAGFRTEAETEATAIFTRSVSVAVDEASPGVDIQGPVTDLLKVELDEKTSTEVVYACGPPGMLEGVRKLCEEYEVPAQLVLEAPMACGFGACYGCVVETEKGYVRLCVDGPVVDSKDLERVP